MYIFIAHITTNLAEYNQQVFTYSVDISPYVSYACEQFHIMIIIKGSSMHKTA